MTDIVKYEKLLEIKLFSGKIIYLPISKRESLEIEMEAKKFIRIHDTTFAVSAIEYVEPLDEYRQDKESMREQESRLIDIGLAKAQLSQAQRIKAREIIANWRLEHKHKFLTQGVIENIIDSILNP